jgi:hypothetical protein
MSSNTNKRAEPPKDKTLPTKSGPWTFAFGSVMKCYDLNC